MAHSHPYMKSLQLQGLNKLIKVELPIPVPGQEEVLIKTEVATICTSDLHDIKTNAFGIKYPRVMGHEGSGVVVACGSGVTDYTPGTRVAAHPVVPCRACSECERGLEHLCLHMSHLGIDRDGCFAEYFVQRADRVRPLPDNISFALGALLEPVAVCLEAISRSNDIKGKTVLVAGDGPFGNIIARLAQRAGAARVLVSGREPFRLKLIPGVEIVDAVQAKSVDIAILAVSAAEAVYTCLQALRPRGRLVIFSTVQEPVALNLFNIHVSELEVVGACNDENKIDESLQCLTEEGLALENIITHQIPFDRWEEAFELARNGHNKALKVALVFD